MSRTGSNEALWLIIYVAISVSYAYLLGTIVHSPYTVMRYSIVASIVFAIIGYYVNRAVLNNVLSIFLFISILSTTTLVRRTFYALEKGGLILILYTSTILFVGILWILSFSVILESNKLKYTIMDWGLFISSVTAMFSFASLHYVLYSYEVLELYEVLVFLIPPSIIVVLLLMFDSFLFKYLLRILSREQRKERSLLYIDLFIHILYSFVLLIPLIVVSILLVAVKPGEKIFTALSILSSYLIAALIVAFIARMYINHGLIIDGIKAPREPYLLESIANFYRMRYISALVLLFNHIEASGREGLEIMNEKASTIVRQGANNLVRLLRRMLLYNRALKLAEELDRIKVILVELPRIPVEFLEDSSVVSSLKSIESNLLKTYQLLVEGKHPGNYVKTVRGNVRKIISILWKHGVKEREVFEEILNVLSELSENPNAINKLVVIRPLLIRDIRNYMVHGRLTREYFYYNNKIIHKIEVLENYDNLYILYSTILSYIGSSVSRNQSKTSGTW